MRLRVGSTKEFCTDVEYEWLREVREAEHPVRYLRLGAWQVIDDGQSEVRTVFGESAEGVHVGIELSCNGGDGPTYWSDPYASLELAEANSRSWYQHCLGEL